MPKDALRPLLDAAKAGDERAVVRFVEATRPAVWRMCRVLGTAGEEEDLVQETYVRALTGLVGFKGSGSVIGWLLTIARNVCADDVRRRTRQTGLIDRLLRSRPREVDDPGDWASVREIVAVLTVISVTHSC